MCIRDSDPTEQEERHAGQGFVGIRARDEDHHPQTDAEEDCLLYTSDAADERSSVDLGGRRIIKKKTEVTQHARSHNRHIHNRTHIQNQRTTEEINRNKER